MVKCLPTMPETRVRSLGQEDPLEKEMATHSSTLAWRIPWMEEPGRLQSMGLQRVRHNWVTSLSFFLSYTVCKSVTCIANTFNCHFSWLLLKSNGTMVVAQIVKCLSTMWETWVRSLGWEDSLEKEMAIHSSTLALKIPWTEERGAGYCPWGHKESGTTERLHLHLSPMEGDTRKDCDQKDTSSNRSILWQISLEVICQGDIHCHHPESTNNRPCIQIPCFIKASGHSF